MGDGLFGDYFDSPVLDAGTYRIRVEDALASSTSDYLRLAARVLEGAKEGSAFYLHLYIAQRNEFAFYHFARKIGGFRYTEKARLAYENRGKLSREELLAAFSECLTGQTVFAEIRVQGPEGGAYEGRNDIVATYPDRTATSLSTRLDNVEIELRELRRALERGGE